jgi:hypothetical protein
VKDPAANPLVVGRIPLTAPPCLGPDDYGVLAPNPCSETVPHTELVPNYDPVEGNACKLPSQEPISPNEPDFVLITRDAPAIRFKNPAMTFDLVDPYYNGDQVCREDLAGALGQIPAVHKGYQNLISVNSGFAEKQLAISPVLPTNVLRGPENSIWVIDEGDHVPDSEDGSSLRGEVFRIESWNIGIINIIQ